MYYIVTKDWQILAKFKTEHGAKISKTSKWDYKGFVGLRIMTADAFHALEPTVETVNLMSGKKVKIQASQKGGCCDPGTERYWSM